MRSANLPGSKDVAQGRKFPPRPTHLPRGGGIEEHLNVRHGVRDGLVRETVVTILRVINPVEMFLRAGEFIRYQDIFKVRLVSSGS